MKVAVLVCLLVACSAVDIKIVSYAAEQGPEPCARVCYGTTAGTLVTSISYKLKFLGKNFVFW